MLFSFLAMQTTATFCRLSPDQTEIARDCVVDLEVVVFRYDERIHHEKGDTLLQTDKDAKRG